MFGAIAKRVFGTAIERIIKRLGAIPMRVFGSANERFINRLGDTVQAINALEPSLQNLADDDLRALTDRYRQRLADGEDLEALLPEAFATVREAAKRALGERPGVDRAWP